MTAFGVPAADQMTQMLVNPISVSSPTKIEEVVVEVPSRDVLATYSLHAVVPCRSDRSGVTHASKRDI